MALSAAFQRVEQEFKRLSDQLAAGQINREQYDAALRDLMIQDAQGRYWTIGANTGKWYVNDGTQWVEAAPPQEPNLTAVLPPTPPAPPPAASVPPTPVAPRAYAVPPSIAPAPPKKSNTARNIAIVIAVILVLCLCLCLVCAFSGVAQNILDTIVRAYLRQ